MIQDSQLLAKFHALPADEQTAVIDFMERLQKREQSAIQNGERNHIDDPILQVVGCVSGPPILTSRAIDEELYGE